MLYMHMANGYGTQMGLALWLPLCFTAPPRSSLPIPVEIEKRRLRTTDSLTNSIELQALSRGLVFHSCQHSPFCHPELASAHMREYI